MGATLWFRQGWPLCIPDMDGHWAYMVHHALTTSYPHCAVSGVLVGSACKQSLRCVLAAHGHVTPRYVRWALREGGTRIENMHLESECVELPSDVCHDVCACSDLCLCAGSLCEYIAQFCYK